jgi:nucleotide-binding universal stress UspA family protein
MTSTVEPNVSYLVVVGVDGSQSSNRALQWAVRQARRRDGARLDVVHAWTAPAIDVDDTWRRAYFETCAREVLDAEAGSLTDQTAPAVRPVLVNAPAAEALIEAASAADLLVVGARGRGGFAGLLLGSVSDRCIVHASCPVAVVPTDWTSDDSGRIVVGVDSSQSSCGALQWALAEAQRRDATLDVVNAYNYHPTMGSPFGPVVIGSHEDVEKASQALLDEMVANLVEAAGAPSVQVELIPSPASAARSLLDAASGADLLVVGSRGHGTIDGVLLGSVSRQCAHHARCPVVVVRPTAARPRS